MNEHLLLDLATDLGYELAISGAETYRVEDSARLVLTAYGRRKLRRQTTI